MRTFETHHPCKKIKSNRCRFLTLHILYNMKRFLIKISSKLENMASQILNNNSSKAARAFTLMIEEEDAKIIHQNLKNSIVEEEAHSVIINEEAEAFRNKAEEFIV